MNEFDKAARHLSSVVDPRQADSSVADKPLLAFILGGNRVAIGFFFIFLFQVCVIWSCVDYGTDLPKEVNPFVTGRVVIWFDTSVTKTQAEEFIRSLKVDTISLTYYDNRYFGLIGVAAGSEMAWVDWLKKRYPGVVSFAHVVEAFPGSLDGRSEPRSGCNTLN